MQRFTVKIKRKGGTENKLWDGIGWGLFDCDTIICVFCRFRGAGGGEVSGGGTHYM
jgi:hypothetical protein